MCGCRPDWLYITSVTSVIFSYLLSCLPLK
jgi:hypothetical protein